MKASMTAATKAIKIFVPSFGVHVHLQIPEALNMAAIESFLLEGEATPDQRRARSIIRTAIREIRREGHLKFGNKEWENG